MSSEAISLWTETSSDPELIAGVRAGDTAAFGVLYERHVDAARKVAAIYTNSPTDIDDVVSESFSRILRALQRGDGPDLAFRAYLFTIVRRTGMDTINKGIRTKPREDMTEYEASIGFEPPSDEPALDGFEHGLVADAFKSLPERWQAVLWYTEVEKKSPREVAPLLGLSANGVAALSYRAREALRQAYLQQHLNGADTVNCLEVNTHLGSYVRGGLSKREHQQVDEHIQSCERCAALAAELQDVNRGMRGVIAPLVLGVAALSLLDSGLPIGGAFGPGVPGAGAASTGAAGAGGVGGTGAAGSAGVAAGAAGGAGFVGGVGGAAGGATGIAGAAGAAGGLGSVLSSAMTLLLPVIALAAAAALVLNITNIANVFKSDSEPLTPEQIVAEPGDDSPNGGGPGSDDDDAPTTDPDVIESPDDTGSPGDSGDPAGPSGGTGGTGGSGGSGGGAGDDGGSGGNNNGDSTGGGSGGDNTGGDNTGGGGTGGAGGTGGNGSDGNNNGDNTGGDGGTGDGDTGGDGGSGGGDTEDDTDGGSTDGDDGSGGDGGDGGGDTGGGGNPGTALLALGLPDFDYLMISRDDPTVGLSITNSGTADAVNVVSTVTVPKGLVFATPAGGGGGLLSLFSSTALGSFLAFGATDEFTSGGWECSLDDSRMTATCELDELAAEDSAQLSLELEVLITGHLDSTAETIFEVTYEAEVTSHSVRTGLLNVNPEMKPVFEVHGLAAAATQVGAPLIGCDPSNDAALVYKCLATMNHTGTDSRNDLNNEYWNSGGRTTIALNEAGGERNSATTTLTSNELPEGATVLYATLKWSSVRGVGDDFDGPLHSARLKAPGTENFINITADEVYTFTGNHGRLYYQSTADVTGLVQAHGVGDWSLADAALPTTRTDVGASYYGGFALTIIYELPSPAKNSRVVMFEGAQWVQPGTPFPLYFELEAPADVVVGLVAWEGRRGAHNDKMRICPNPHLNPSPCGSDVVPISADGSRGEPNNIADSTAWGSKWGNTLGVDAKHSQPLSLSANPYALWTEANVDQFLIGTLTLTITDKD